MDKDILNQLLLIMIPVLTAAAAFAVSWLRAKTKELSRKSEEEKAQNNFDMLDKVVLDVAKTLSQTLVEELEKAHSDGRLSFEDMESVKLEALELIYLLLDESIILTLKKTTKDLDCLICSKFESNLLELKNHKNL